MHAKQTTESRQIPRMRVLKEGKLALGLTTIIDVRVRDLCAGGARLMLSGHVNLPAEFRLAVGLSRNFRPVRLCWQSSNQVGVAFTDVDGGDAPPPAEAAAEAAGEGPEEAFTKVMGEEGETAHFSLAYRLSRAPSAERPGTGHCVIDLRIGCTGTIDAERPFLALPQLGPEVVAAEKWNAREIVTLRKLVRVARVDDVPLAPGPTTRCCALHLPYTKEGGGYVVYGRGIEHSLASLPDFKLACQVGAGNFPAERLALHVPAADIARLLNN